MLEGLAKHNGPVGDPPWALAEADAEFPLDLASWPSLEAQIAAVADDIAYDNHDIDDGLRAGLFTLEQALEVPLVARAWGEVRARYPDLPAEKLVPEVVRDLIGTMVNDVLAETRRRCDGMSSAEDVRAAGRSLAGFSSGMAAEERALKSFLYAHMYDAASVRAVRQEAQRVLAELFAAYRADPMLLPEDWRPQSLEPVTLLRAIGDFVAGMTDRYAVRRHAEISGASVAPTELSALT